MFADRDDAGQCSNGLASFCMTMIVSLRILALVSDILFGTCGLLAHIYLVFFLYILPLPINLVKL